jgi:glycosyltransferase involved in cell wall biosynthesis
MKISIITISFNPGASLKRTILSVTQQTYPHLEWIVVDGGSTDESISLYKQVHSKISYLISEKDQGIADAMNKGLKIATGDAVIYMNAGDEFYSPASVEALVSAWELNRFDWVTGMGATLSEDGKLLYTRDLSHLPAQSLVDKGCRIYHPATAVKRTLLTAVGGFDLSFRSSMDYELWLRLIKQGHLPQVIATPIAKFYLGGTSGNLLRRYLEDRRARQLHGFSNPATEVGLEAIARLKQSLGGLTRYKWAYRIKEALKL